MGNLDPSICRSSLYMDNSQLRCHLTYFIADEIFENLHLVSRVVLGYSQSSFSRTSKVSPTRALR
jgi:hypothetical protein